MEEFKILKYKLNSLVKKNANASQSINPVLDVQVFSQRFYL